MRGEFVDLAMQPPPGKEWQIGKNAATIRFVNEADAYLASLPAARFQFDTEVLHGLLREETERLKSGEKELIDFMTVQEFFAQSAS